MASPQYFSSQVSSALRFYLPGKKTADWHLESGGCEECLPSYKVDRDNFPHYSLEFISRGSADIRLGAECWKLQPGSVFVYNGKTPHRLAANSREGLTKFFLVLNGRAIPRILLRHGIRVGHVITIGNFSTLTDIFWDLIHAGTSSRPGRKHDCLAIFRHLLLKIEELAESNLHVMSGAYSAYRRCRNHINNNYLTLRSVTEVARACGVNHAYLCRLFQRFSTESPRHFFTRLRMDHATRQLHNREISAKEAGEELGFSDAAAFSRAYKKWFGIPPGAARQGKRI